MLPLLLILMIFILVIPLPLSKTLKKTWPVFAVLLAVVFAILIDHRLPMKDANKLVIEALNEKNEASKGTEIWLIGINVDGKEAMPKDYFSSEWITENRALVWRSYDQKEGMFSSISSNFKPGSRVILKFQTNKWRGKAQVSFGKLKEKIDFYTDSENLDQAMYYTITIPESSSKVYFNAKNILLLILIVLIILNLLYMTLYYLRKHELPFDNIVCLNREIWLDILKVTSSIMIILIHSTGNVYISTFSQDPKLWINILWLNAVPRFAVPCFLMITGVFALGKKYDFDKVLYHKILRILIPLLVWSAIYIMLRKFLWQSNENIEEELLKIPFKQQDGSLWYAYQLIWIYLGMPFWQILYQHLTQRLRWYFVIFSLGIPGILTILGELSLLNVPEYLPFASIEPLICYVGVLFLGKILYDTIIVSKSFVILGKGVILASCGLCIMIVASIYVSKEKNEAVSIFFSEVRLPSILYGSGMFLIFASMKDLYMNLPQFFKLTNYAFSKVSLGIYLSHCLMIWAFPSITMAGIYIKRDSGSILQMLICVIIYYGITATGCILLSNLPGLKKLVL